MSGGEALDLALGLLRAPARRGLLVTRPLPTGMTTLLEVAGGSARAARDASAATGATPEELLEASRFFVQQVLFHESANAYRILGARPDAPQPQLASHHRLLQRWLHPDRDGGLAWDSAFSARVNEAWSRLRSPQARREYDAQLAARGPATASHAPAAPGADRGPVARVPAHRSPPPASTVPVAGHRVPLSESAVRSVRGPFAVLAVTLACLALLWLARQGAAPPALDLDSRPTAAAERSATEPDPATRGAEPPAPDAPDAHPAPIAARQSVQAEPLAATVGETGTELPANSPQPVAHPADLPHAADARDADDPAVAAYEGAEAVRDEVPANDEANIRSPAHAAIEPAPAVVSSLLQDSPIPQTTPTLDPLQLFQQAEATLAQAASYLASDGSRVPPVWNDFPTEVAAAEARARLVQRLADAQPVPIQLVQPRWRMGDQRAGVEAGYRVASLRGDEEGRLHVEMTRREQRWLITHLALEPTP